MSDIVLKPHILMGDGDDYEKSAVRFHFFSSFSNFPDFSTHHFRGEMLTRGEDVATRRLDVATRKEITPESREIAKNR